jgi:hypothetical protein
MSAAEGRALLAQALAVMSARGRMPSVVFRETWADADRSCTASLSWPECRLRVFCTNTGELLAQSLPGDVATLDRTPAPRPRLCP